MWTPFAIIWAVDRKSSICVFCIRMGPASKDTRCVVAEEKLHEHFEKQREHHGDDDAGTNLGINGFGNLAFPLKSKLVLWVSETESK